MNVEPLFVPGGVYLQTPTGELIGRLDESGSPFASLDEAREKLDWLELALQFQQAQREREIPARAARSPLGMRVRAIGQRLRDLEG